MNGKMIGKTGPAAVVSTWCKKGVHRSVKRQDKRAWQKEARAARD